MKIFMLVVATLLLGGCGITNVKAWEKGTLAKNTMKNSAGNTLFKKFESHIYFSKEGSKGGGGVAGGGCGCN